MTQAPVTVTYSLEEVLGQIIQKLDRMDTKIEALSHEVVELKIGQARLESELKGEMKSLALELKGEMKTLEAGLKAEMKILETNLKTLETETRGIAKRLDTQEFINRSVVVGFILALVAGVVKLFLPYGVG